MHTLMGIAMVKKFTLPSQFPSLILLYRISSKKAVGEVEGKQR